ncbi:hypothetical protein WMY93_031388 [Mugilogobius chulae]|uniref:Uncharacterized protein n=1 Tax=Mugilogobius chulae TaxID=88201 RepID=A0AAW0MFR1_9GOBI
MEMNLTPPSRCSAQLLKPSLSHLNKAFPLPGRFLQAVLHVSCRVHLQRGIVGKYECVWASERFTPPPPPPLQPFALLEHQLLCQNWIQLLDDSKLSKDVRKRENGVSQLLQGRKKRERKGQRERAREQRWCSSLTETHE